MRVSYYEQKQRIQEAELGLPLRRAGEISFRLQSPPGRDIVEIINNTCPGVPRAQALLGPAPRN